MVSCSGGRVDNVLQVGLLVMGEGMVKRKKGGDEITWGCGGHLRILSLV